VGWKAERREVREGTSTWKTNERKRRSWSFFPRDRVKGREHIELCVYITCLYTSACVREFIYIYIYIYIDVCGNRVDIFFFSRCYFSPSHSGRKNIREAILFIDGSARIFIYGRGSAAAAATWHLRRALSTNDWPPCGIWKYSRTHAHPPHILFTQTYTPCPAAIKTALHRVQKGKGRRQRRRRRWKWKFVHVRGVYLFVEHDETVFLSSRTKLCVGVCVYYDLYSRRRSPPPHPPTLPPFLITWIESNFLAYKYDFVYIHFYFLLRFSVSTWFSDRTRTYIILYHIPIHTALYTQTDANKKESSLAASVPTRITPYT